MQNRTPVERIQDEIEKGIARQFYNALFEMEINRHTRRGTRDDCDCEYCQLKRRATISIAFAAGNIALGRPYGPIHCSFDDRWDLFQTLKQTARDRVRRQYRALLKDAIQHTRESRGMTS